jgi:hypothetical protein
MGDAGIVTPIQSCGQLLFVGTNAAGQKQFAWNQTH